MNVQNGKIKTDRQKDRIIKQNGKIRQTDKKRE